MLLTTQADSNGRDPALDLRVRRARRVKLIYPLGKVAVQDCSFHFVASAMMVGLGE